MSRHSRELDALPSCGAGEELKIELEHLDEVYRAKREYEHQLEVDEANEGSSWPPARRLELRKLRKELNDLKARIQILTESISVPSPATPVSSSANLMANPGFEEGFAGWREDPDQYKYGSQSVEDTAEAHSGQRSRRLFLCRGGSHIIQDVSLPTPLSAGSVITLKAWVKMPHPGSQSNKFFTLELAVASMDGQRDHKFIDQLSALPDWSQLYVGPLVAEFPVAHMEVHAMTSKGDGSHKSLDQPVWVDDFELDIRSAMEDVVTTAETPDLASESRERAQRSPGRSVEFDVFLAHNSQDKPLVEAIAAELKRRGLNPWLDKEQILPGRLFQDVIQEAIPIVKSAAIFIGPRGLGRWQSVELRTLISQCVERDLPVIPVLLPGVTEIPPELLFLREFSQVQFVENINEIEALDNLERGIIGESGRTVTPE